MDGAVVMILLLVLGCTQYGRRVEDALAER